MRRDSFTGLYGDCLPTGEYAYVASQRTVGSHRGDIPAPEWLMETRITAVGGFRIVAKAHDSGRATVWDGQWTQDGRISHGVQGHIWTPDGTLFVWEPCTDCESQGVRYWDNGPVFGSPTYNPFTDLAREKGVTRLYEWTALRNDLFVGQGAEGGTVIQYQGQHYLLEPGDSRFVQAHREGDRLAIAITKLNEERVVFYWLTVSEIAALSIYPTPNPGPVEPVPGMPDPEPEPMPDYPLPEAVYTVVLRMAEKFPELRKGDDDARRAFTLKVAQQVRRDFGPAYGTKRADPGRPLSKDAIARKTNALLVSWDLINGATREVHPAPIMGEDISDQVFVPVDPVDHLGSIPVPDDPPPSVPDYAAQIAELRAHITVMQGRITDIDDDIKEMSTALGTRLANLKVRGRNGRTWSHSHSWSGEVYED